MKEKLGTYEKVPLMDDEKKLLLLIYGKRKLVLFMGYSVLIFLAMIFSPKGDAIGARIVTLLTLQSAIIGTGIYLYFKNVRTFRKDAESGMKDKVPYTVIRREYFEFTDQYYIALDHPNYLHHEIDQDMYYNVREGDCIYLYRATRSKYVFERNGRFFI
jgi:hypothetical protein